MARIIIVEGKSGTGKTTSLRNLPHMETFVLSPNGKGLSFPGWKAKYTKFENGQGNLMRVEGLEQLKQVVEMISSGAPHIKYLVIDDYSHYFNKRIFSDEFMAQNSGGAVFERWAVFGADVYKSFWKTADQLREDLTIIVNHHTDVAADGSVGFRTVGKMLGEKIDCPSIVEYILHTRVLDGENGSRSYKFMTNTDGVYEAKTPMGMFSEQFIDNDINAVIQRIDAYENGTLDAAT